MTPVNWKKFLYSLLIEMLLHHCCIFYIFSFNFWRRRQLLRLLVSSFIRLSLYMSRPQSRNYFFIVIFNRLSVNGSWMSHFWRLSWMWQMSRFHKLISRLRFLYFCKLIFLKFRFNGMFFFILENLINFYFLFSYFLFDHFCCLIIFFLDCFVYFYSILSQLLTNLVNQSYCIFIVICILIILVSYCFFLLSYQSRNSLLDIGFIFLVNCILIYFLTLLLGLLQHHFRSLTAKNRKRKKSNLREEILSWRERFMK